MRSLISLVLLSGCFATNDSAAPSSDLQAPAPDQGMDLSADAKRCHNIYFRDSDGDGYGASRKAYVGCAAPAGYVKTAGDCNDTDATVNPAAPEICDGVDQNCNGIKDEKAIDAPNWYRDSDRDGHGDPSEAKQTCVRPIGYVTGSDDCDDTSPAVYWGAPEVCDGLDNDCDNSVDNNPEDGITVYPDADGDGWGLDSSAFKVCTVMGAVATQEGDCDDADPSVHPTAAEVCNSRDDDCNGSIDENAVDATTWYPDVDADGHGAKALGVTSCSAPLGQVMVPLSDDCNDANPSVHPGVSEVCDGIDNDCSGQADDNAVDGVVYYQDVDADGFGDAMHSTIACSMPTGFTRNSLDCDDSSQTAPAYVDLVGLPTGSGTLVDPMISIQSAVDTGVACVVLGSGTFQEDLDLSSYKGTISSLNGSWDTTIQGLGDGPVITMENGSVTLHGITITGAGPGTWNYQDLSEDSCIGTRESVGGGMLVERSSVALDDVVLDSNDITDATPDRPECMSIVDSIGGGIYAESSYLTLNEVQVKNNVAVDGGGLALVDSVVTAQRVRVTGTTGGSSSDVMVDGGTFTANNLLMNGAADIGLSTQGSVTTITQALFGGYDTAWSASDTATVSNSIFLDNGTAMGGAATWSVSYTDSYNNAVNWPATVGAGTLSVDPQLTEWSDNGDASDDNYVLLASSPLIDAGDPSTADKDGSVADIGPLGGEGGW